MLHKPEMIFRQLKRFFSKSRWLVQLLGLNYVSKDSEKRGLVLVQIDAVSRKQFERALSTGKMPFVKSLIESQHYKMWNHYSGMPCATPGAQGELFYGVKCCVPSFSFYDRQTERVFAMFNPAEAREIQSRLEEQGKGLFEGGSAYSNIFTGSASEPHFCIADLRLSEVFKLRRTIRFLAAVVFHSFSLLRVAGLLVVEFSLALIDFFRGLTAGENLWKELKFVPSRVGLCVLLREIIIISSKLDMTRGLPIIQLNLIGYHEQSHRRGASSKFALWTLKGIDNSIKRIWKSSIKAEKEYDFWIYSDHGQVDSLSYEGYFGESIQETVRAALAPGGGVSREGKNNKRLTFLNRLGWRLNKRKPEQPEQTKENSEIIVTDIAPEANVYLPEKMKNQKRQAAEKLIRTGKIPLIFFCDDDKVIAKNSDGEFEITPGSREFFDNDFVPYEIAEDFINKCRSDNAGDLVISGYQGRTLPYFTFKKENGSHGGIHEEEYTGFVLAPENDPFRMQSRSYLRPLDLRKAAFEVLGKTETLGGESIKKVESRQPDVFRVMTYNVHSCVGMDGKLSPLRIARVLEQYDPDIVCLQELDLGREKTGQKDQTKIIAEILEMDHFFLPALEYEEEQYGDAILSRFPMKLLKADLLPGVYSRYDKEPRGALLAEIEISGRKIQLVNTHLGLTGKNQNSQIDALLGESWEAGSGSTENYLLCGDFNFDSRSSLYRKCSETFKEAVPDSPPYNTYCGRHPFLRIDHIFYKGKLKPVKCSAGDSDLDRIASDHRPLIADFKFSD
ncbi:endonuclease/exonuclease/phosphatase family protein [Sedimentisphaera salicampi]|uniref:endonuclease/exonuclease/phosphatase family protein n=1 Tax=Sedimentisphaera salicampi TaxID=1941349 RepID=UPI000B9B7AA2|nr:endonuclease/exonuclease/phosphatase family protein [Sedimentisphaera salicampi]OXU14102.1 exodeoxyribonuclease III (xth) [Sedimentisphaera salicampi]